LGDKDSPFILGLLKEGYKENTFENPTHTVRSKFNGNLLEISNKLNLSVPLNIGEMLGHSNSVVTEHYLASLDIEKTNEINQHIL
jgi:site-specific recombinase XerC